MAAKTWISVTNMCEQCIVVTATYTFAQNSQECYNIINRRALEFRMILWSLCGFKTRCQKMLVLFCRQHCQTDSRYMKMYFHIWINLQRWLPSLLTPHCGTKPQWVTMERVTLKSQGQRTNGVSHFGSRGSISFSKQILHLHITRSS